MNRRSIFSLLFQADLSPQDISAQSPTPRILASGLQPHSAPLELRDAYHLLRRVSFGAKRGLAETLVGKSATEAVEILLSGGETNVQNPPTWIDETFENPRGADIFTRNAIWGKWGNQFTNFQLWIANRMIAENIPTGEKITLFWSGHFTTEFSFDEDYIPPQQLFRQYSTLFNDRLGSFQKMVYDITLDGAMLAYLGGNLNVKGKPNENYARELMELFTTGIGHYTEGDVQEAARVLTGWKIGLYHDEPAFNEIYNSYFLPSAHDVGAKQVMGRSIPARDTDSNTEYLVKTQEVLKLIEIVFDVRKNAVAQFMAQKFYRFFVYSKPGVSDQDFIGQFAQVFLDNNFEIRPTLATLLSSEHFFDEQNRGVQIKTPVEFIVGLIRQLDIQNTGSVPAYLSSLEQTLFDPPNVSGWDGYRTWLSTKTYPLRRKYSSDLILGLSDSDLLNFAKKFDDYEDADKLCQQLELYFFPKPVDSNRHNYYLNDALLQRQPVYEWASMMNAGTPAARGLRALLTTFVKSPAFQLC